jgi:hypothetical protein
VQQLFQQRLLLLMIMMLCSVLVQKLQLLLEPGLVLQQGLIYCLAVALTLRVLHQSHQSHHPPSHLLLACLRLRPQQELCWLPQQLQKLELLLSIQVELQDHLQQVAPRVLLPSGVFQRALLLTCSALNCYLLAGEGRRWFLCLQ